RVCSKPRHRLRRRASTDRPAARRHAMKVIATVVASTLLLTGTTASAADQVTQDALRAAASKSLALFERTGPTFLKKGGCNSCHNQMLPAAAQAFARSRGVPTGAPLAQLAPELSEQTTERYLEYSVGGGAGVNAIGFDLFGRALAHERAD